MKSIKWPFAFLIGSQLLLSQTACSAQPQLQPASPVSTKPPAVPADTTPRAGPPVQSRATIAQVKFAYPYSRCAYPYSPTNFCDVVHINAYTQALQGQTANFASDRILLNVSTRPEYHQKSLVVIEPDTGAVWPFPFDAYAGSLDVHGNPVGEGALDFSIDSSTVCIEGSLLVYRVIEAGRFCFTFDGGRFEGHTTQYMQESDD
ncbi:hypothetical protein ACW7GZ_03995 [Luteimonas sp. A537]